MLCTVGDVVVMYLFGHVRCMRWKSDKIGVVMGVAESGEG